MTDQIKEAWRRGDDTAAAKWILRYRRLKYRPQCLRAFRVGRAYKGEIGQIMQRAFAAVQRRRSTKSYEKENQ